MTGLLARARATRAARWLAEHIFLAGFVVLFGMNFAGAVTLQAEQAARLEGVERADAQRCIDQHQTVAATRDALERSARIPADALAEVVTSSLDGNVDALVARYQALVDDSIAEARGELTEPDCDLETARRRLGMEDGQ